MYVTSNRKDLIMIVDDIVIGVETLRDDVILPEFKQGNAGTDLRVITEDGQPVTIKPHTFHKFHTGIKLDIPEWYYVEVVPRSSTGVKKNIRLLNTKGVIDSTYKGEILLFVENFGELPVTIENNERLMQMLLYRTYNITYKKVDSVGTSERGEGGFGSTGDK